MRDQLVQKIDWNGQADFVTFLANVVGNYAVCTVDFVLRDPRESVNEPVPLVLPEHREELTVLPKPWHTSFVQACRSICDSLHVTNPCMQQLSQLWFTFFRYASSFNYVHFF